MVKKLSANARDAGDPGSVPGLGRSPGEGNGNPLQYYCLGKPMERGLAGYSSWGHKESDVTYQLKNNKASEMSRSQNTKMEKLSRREKI